MVLPANSIARVAQTSLLGSQHVELAAPPNQAPVGRLVDGSAIQEARTSRFPTTEEVFSALGVVVNKGNLGALQEITDETYQAVAGREGQFTNLVPRLAELTAGLTNQVNDIVAAIDGLDRFSTILADNKDSLGRTLETLPEALRVLNKNRDKIVEAFGALKKVATVAAHVLSQTKVDFAADLKDIYANVKALADNRKNFVTSMQLLLTFPFPNFGIKQAVRGDYLNVFTTFDLTVRRLGETFFTTSWPLDPNMLHMKDILNPPDFLLGEMANLSGQAADPFKIPPGTQQGTTDAGPTDSRPTGHLRGGHGDHRRDHGDLLPAVTGRAGHRHLPGDGQLRSRRRALQERQRHLPRRRGGPGRGGGPLLRRCRRGNATEQRHLVPSNVTASVKSVSAIGEQYIDLVPPRMRLLPSCTTDPASTGATP